MAGGGKDQQREADTILLIKSLQKIAASTYHDAETATREGTYDAETTTREEIEAKHRHYNQRDSYFQRRILYLEKEIYKEKMRAKSAAALIQPIREEQEEELKNCS